MILEPSVAGLFKWRHFEPEMILLAVDWYLRFSLSCRDVEDSLLSVDCWSTTSPSGGVVQRYAPQIQRRLRPPSAANVSQCNYPPVLCGNFASILTTEKKGFSSASCSSGGLASGKDNVSIKNFS
jgi:hypothetical protein